MNFLTVQNSEHSRGRGLQLTEQAEGTNKKIHVLEEGSTLCTATGTNRKRPHVPLS